MIIKVFTKNERGNIELTTGELEKIMNEAYWDGYSEGKRNFNTITWTSPDWNQPYYTITTTATNATLKHESQTDKNAMTCNYVNMD